MEQWIESFLYRGRPPSGPGSELPCAFQVEIGQQVADPFDPSGPPSRRVTLPLTPEQAATAGFHLADLITGINADAIEENANLTNEIADLRVRLAEAESALASAVARLSPSSSGNTVPG